MPDPSAQPHTTAAHAEPPNRQATTPLGEQLAQRYAQRIGEHLLAPGARLPSVRDGARRHGVSPATIVAAYDRLLARGLIESRPQRGFFVRPPARAATAASARSAGGAPVPGLPPPVDATALMRGMFQQGPRPSPGMGTLPEDWLDGALLQRALRRAIGGEAEGALRYGDPAGDAGLRLALSRRLGELGIAASADQVVTTLGATHALDLVARTLLKPGDAVLVDDPGWAIEFARLTRLGVRLLSVPRGPDGPDLAVFEALARAHAPRMYVTVSVLHNPTGGSISLASAHRLLQLAEAHALTVVEDDTYAWLSPPHAPRLAALDGLRRTVHIGGVSKVLSPGWRVGWLAAPSALVPALVDAKLISALTTPALFERATAWCLDSGQLHRHAQRMVQRLAAARERVVRQAVRAHATWAAEPQGLFGWLDLGVDTGMLAQTMFDDGWLLAPGHLFHADGRADTRMRLNFASSGEPRFWRALALARQRV